MICYIVPRLQYSAAHCPGVDRKRSRGFYTGGLDQDFLPHTPDQHGVLTVPSDPPVQIKALWVHGCPSGAGENNIYFALQCLLSTSFPSAMRSGRVDEVEPLLRHERSWNEGEKAASTEGTPVHGGAVPSPGPNQVVPTR